MLDNIFVNMIVTDQFGFYILGTCEPYSFNEFAACLFHKLGERFQRLGVSCVQFLLNQYIPKSFKFSDCETSVEAGKTFAEFFIFGADNFNSHPDIFNQNGNICGIPCDKEIYHLDYFSLNSLGTTLTIIPDKCMQIWFS